MLVSSNWLTLFWLLRLLIISIIGKTVLKDEIIVLFGVVVMMHLVLLGVVMIVPPLEL